MESENKRELQQFVDHNSFCTFITYHEDGLFVSHINLINVGDTYFGHLAAANPQAKRLRNNSTAIALFKNNKKAVHIHGRISLIRSEHHLSCMLDNLISKYENGRSTPWSAKWNEPEFKMQLKGIVGFHLLPGKIQDTAAPVDIQCMSTVKVTPIYTPYHFVEKRPEILHQLIRDNPFCTVILHNKNGYLSIFHIDLTISSRENEKLVLEGRLLIANTKQLFNTNDTFDALLIFNGPHTYISPSWYKTPHSVPTWNYITAHAESTFTITNTKNEDNNLALGIRFNISQIIGKYKLSQNRSPDDKCNVISALSESSCLADFKVAELMKIFSLV